jgi:hypothetical protein
VAASRHATRCTAGRAPACAGQRLSARPVCVESRPRSSAARQKHTMALETHALFTPHRSVPERHRSFDCAHGHQVCAGRPRKRRVRHRPLCMLRLARDAAVSAA